MVLAHYGRHVSMATLRQVSGVSRDCVSAPDLLRIADHFNLETRVKRCEPEGLSALGFPLVVYLDFIHFAVVEGIDDAGVDLNDPSYGRYRMPREIFAESFTGIALTFTPGAGFTPAGRPTPVWRRALRQAAFAPWIGLAGALIAGSLSPMPILAWLIAVGTGALEPGMIRSLSIGAGALALSGALAGGAAFALARLESDFVRARLVDLPRHLLAQPFAFFVYRLPSVLSGRVTNQEAIARILFRDLPRALVGIAAVPVVLAGLTALHSTLGLVATLIVLSCTGLFTALARAAGRAGRPRQDDGEAHWFKLSHSLETFESFKTSGGDREVFRDLMGLAADKLEVRQRTALFRNLAELTPDLALLILVPVALACLWLEPPDMGAAPWTGVVILALVVALSLPMRAIGALHGQIERLQLTLPPLDDLLDSPAEESGHEAAPAQAAQAPSGMPLLRLDGVSFGFSHAKPALLHDISLTLDAGEWVALTGASGGGKSTLVGLAIGLHRPWAGSAEFAGRPMAMLGRHALARDIGWINKHAFFTPGTLRDNIRLWDDTIPDADIDRAVKDACLVDVVASLPDGLDSMIGQRAETLSGGQRQRIEIARALARRPRLLILDEATDGLDRQTEERLFRALRRRGVAVLIVSHRVSTIAACTRVLRLEDGILKADDRETLGEGAPVNAIAASITMPEEPSVRSEPANANPDALFAAFRTVARAAGIADGGDGYRLQAPSDRERSPIQTLQEIGRQTGIGVRTVRLTVADWRRCDHGPLIAFAKDDGRPLAVVPDGHGGWSVSNPCGGSTAAAPVDWEKLAITACTLYPRFRRAPVTVSDFFTHPIRPMRADLGWLLGADITLALMLAILPPVAYAGTVAFRGGAPPGTAAFWLVGGGLLIATALTAAAAHLAAQGRLEGILQLSANNALFQHLLRLRPLFVGDRTPTEINRSLHGVPTILGLLRDGSARRTIGLIGALGCIAVIASVSGGLALLALALLAPAGIVVGILAARRRAHAVPFLRCKAAGGEMLLRLLLAAPKHHQAARENAALDTWAAHVDAERRLADPLHRLDTAVGVFLAWHCCAVSMIFIGATAWHGLGPDGGLSAAGSLAAALAFLLAALTVRGAGEAGCAAVRGGAAVTRLRALAQAPTDPLSPDADRPPATRPEAPPLVLDRVSYRYPGRREMALDAVSLRIGPGEVVALSGPTGCGKSTLLRLALGFMPPRDGTVLRDGADERAGDLSAWREHVGAVMQDDLLEVAMTIRGHIGGHEGFSLAEVREAVRAAQLEADIDAMPMGIQSIVDAERVSTGQKQRILIARRLVRRPRLLILDEATNALSDPMQAALIREIRAMGIACLIVTHRESALALADRVYRMEAGRIVFEGASFAALRPPTRLAQVAEEFSD